ncbi:hypothetical protein O1L68_29110 [Streptomyces lydicus]|nr:hypothetical protein [Streptomyces lydicus]MCZ1010153.1 hypothetical protein [Streptomyces lydicus]
MDTQSRVFLAQQGERRRDERRHGRPEGGDPQGAGDGGRRGGDIGLGPLQALQALQQNFRVGHQDLGLLGQPYPPPHRLQQHHTHLGLQHRELLRDRGRTVRKGPP